MKVLCLHGKGTSGSIFRSQISSFRSKLPEGVEFDFLDGLYDSDAAAGIDLFYSPPYYSWWKNDTVDDIRGSCEWLNDYIAENGPYDLALMFSQGCVLGSSALLFHQEETPHLPPPFKAAIFVCGGPSTLVMEELGFHVAAEARERDTASRKALSHQAGSSALLSRGADRWKGLESLNNGLSDDQLREEITSPLKIKVPTVHIYGAKDPRYASGVHLSGICDAEKRKTFDHGGGHEIPRTAAVSNSIYQLFKWAAEQAGCQ